MARVITNTFTLTVVPDVEATRPNLVHCSAFNKDRMGWWIQPTSSNAHSFKVAEGKYGIDGYNAYELQALPGTSADIRQYVAKEYKGTHDEYNANKDNYGLDPAKWYTLSFRVKGLAQKKNADGSYTANGETRLYVYLVGNNGGGVSVIDTAAKYIVDGVEQTPTGDMCTAVTLNWTATVHTITFKTRSDLKTAANAAIPVLYFRSFGEGSTAYPSYFANGSCYFRISCIKIEEGIAATAYTPHATELLPPVHAVAFRRTNTDISSVTPTGGTYASPTPADWSDGIPSGEQRLWETKAVFVPELPTATWSKPSPVGDTSDSDVEFSPYSGTPTSEVSNNLAPSGTAATSTTNKWFDPVRNSDADFSKMIWRAERRKQNGTWSGWTIIKVKGETGEAGKDAVLLDLDNEMDSIAVDSSGTVTSEQSVTTNVTIFKGATAQYITDEVVAASSLNGVTASKTSVNGKVSVTFTFPVGTTFADQHYTAVIGVTFGGVTYTATFTLAPVRLGKDACLYKVLPSMSSCPFTRNEDNLLVPAILLVSCGYVAVKGDKSSTVSSCFDVIDGAYRIYYRMNSIVDGWSAWSKHDEILQVLSRPNVTLSAFEFCIAKSTADALEDETLIVDREVVPVVVGGANGADGENAFIVDLDNEMDAIPCDSTGRLSSQRTYNLNLGAFYGTQEAALTSVVATIKDCNGNTPSGISVSTTTPKAPVVTVSAGTYNASPYTISLECTSDYGTRTVVFTLVTQKAGAPGETPTIYQLAPSMSSINFTRNADNTLSPATISIDCGYTYTTGTSTSKQTGEYSSIGGMYSIYYRYKDGSGNYTTWQLMSASLSIPNSTSYISIEFALSSSGSSSSVSDSNIIDRETIPILKDGSKGLPGYPGDKGDPGDDGTIAWLSCPYVAISCDKDGCPKIDSFTVNAFMRIGNQEPTSTTSSYKIAYSVYYKENTTVSSNTTGSSINVPLVMTQKLSGVTITLSYGDTVIQSLVLNAVLDGPMGSAGYNYLPQVLGIYSSSQEYTWDDTVRQGCFYEISGKYNIYYVKTRMTTNKGVAPTGDKDDPYWSMSDRYYTIFTDAIYTTNANVGGFLASDKMLVSSEAAYNMTYRGYPPYKYRGTYSSSKTYSSGDIVLQSGTYYLYTGSSSRTDLKSDTVFGSYLINMVTGLSSDTTVYGYYDPTNRADRPFIYFVGKFYTPKANVSGPLTTSPTASDTQWRELFPAEKYMLGITSSSGSTSFPHSEANIYTRSISKYVLNGKQGTTTMLQVDDTVWEYDEGGNQTLGVPYGKHIEISPAGGKVMFFGSDGTQNGEMSGEAVGTIAELVGQNSVSPSGSLSQQNVYGDGKSGRRQQYENTVVSSFQLTSSGSLTVNSSITVGGNQWETSLAGGGVSSDTGPLLDGMMILGSSNRRYTNTMSAVLVVQSLSNGTWEDVGAASLQRSTTETNIVATFSSSTKVVVSAGTYRIIVRYIASVYANNSYKAWVIVNSCTVTVVSLINLHRFFGNGFAFGSASNNFFAAVNEGSNMRIKALTSAGKYGFELDNTNGLLGIRNGFTAKVPILVYYGFYNADTTILAHYYCFDEDNKPELTCTKDGDYTFKIPLAWSNAGMSLSGGSLIPTIICKVGTVGVSAQINSWYANSIQILTANDTSLDKTNLLIKLEYIG